MHRQLTIEIGTVTQSSVHAYAPHVDLTELIDAARVLIAALDIIDLDFIEEADLFGHVLTDRIAMAQATALAVTPGVYGAFICKSEAVRLA